MQNFFDVVQTRTGDAIYGASVSVYDSNGALAIIYSDNGVTQQTNPITTNQDGEYSFFAADGKYSVTISASGYDTQVRSGIVLYDAAAAQPLYTTQVLLPTTNDVLTWINGAWRNYPGSIAEGKFYQILLYAYEDTNFSAIPAGISWTSVFDTNLVFSAPSGHAVVTDFGYAFEVLSGGALSTAFLVNSNGTVSSSAAPTTAWNLTNKEYVDPYLKGVPQNAQTGNYTLVLEDAGKHIYHANGAGAGDIYTIPANASVAYSVGTAITFVNMDSNSVSINITTDTMYLAGTGTTGSRTLAQYGVATALKLTSTTWLISGTGLT